MIVTFCGHSQISQCQAVERWLYGVTQELITRGATTFYLGGYGAFDNLAASVLRRQKMQYPQIELVLVMAYLNDGRDASGYDRTIYPPLETVPRRYAIRAGTAGWSNLPTSWWPMSSMTGAGRLQHFGSLYRKRSRFFLIAMKWVSDTVCRSPLAGRAANIFLKVPVMARPGCYNENNENNEKQSPEADSEGASLRDRKQNDRRQAIMANLPSTETMERISRQELADNLDAVLDRVLRENIGLVITDAGKDDLVLCPSSWLDPFHTEDFGSVINCALRYAMHAEDKESEAVIRYLRHRCGILDEKTLSVAGCGPGQRAETAVTVAEEPAGLAGTAGMFRQQLAALREAPLENAEQQDPPAKHDEP